MAIHCAVRDDALVIEPVGAYTTSELRDAVNHAMTEPTYRPGLSLLFDMRRAVIVMDDQVFRERVEWAVGLTRRGFRPRIATVFAPHQTAIVERSVELIDGRVEISTFTNMPDALAWLATPPRR